MNIYVDFEANGGAQAQEIISIGAISETGESFYSLVRPHGLLDRKIKELTHISQEDASAAPTIEDVMKSFKSWISNLSDKKVKFLVFGSSDRQFVSNSIGKTDDKETIETLIFLHNRIENVEKRVAKKFNRKNIGLQSAYLTMRNLPYESMESSSHNALFDAGILKYVWENIDEYELPEGIEPVAVPKIDMGYGKRKNKNSLLKGTKKTKAHQAILRCPEIASKRFDIKVRCTKGTRKPIIFNNLRAALTLYPGTIYTADEKLKKLEQLYTAVKTGEPFCGWTIEEVE